MTGQINEYGNQVWRNEYGKLHRIDGPAIIYDDGELRWYINDKIYFDNKSFQSAANITDEDMIAIVLKYGNVK